MSEQSIVNLNEWYQQKRNEVYATGWRPHGLSVGDKVRFHCEYDYRDDELWEYIEGKERPIAMVIENNSVGTITELLDLNTVRVELPCVISYENDNESQQHYEDTQVIEGELLTHDEINKLGSLCHAFKVIREAKSNPKGKQLSLF